MKPIAIFRHAPAEGPGYFAEFLDAHALSWQLICIDAGEAVPADARAFSGLVFMGGPMSVNDSLPWIAPVLELIRDGVARDLPVLGHCLGGQLMSFAWGSSVRKNPVKEIGWGEVGVAPSEEARAWLGNIHSATVFHWHGEAFSLPVGAVRLLSSKHCINQAYVLGKHLALQCHVEMTEAMIREWCELGEGEIAASLHSAGVQSATAILNQMPQHLPALRGLADALYSQWIGGLKRD